MKFQFNVNLTDKDYLDFNLFWQFKSPYGKKQMRNIRVAGGIVFVAFALLNLVGGDYSSDAFINAAFDLVGLVIFQLILNPLFIWIFKLHIKSAKKSGKMGYSPVSTMEFYEDNFLEICPENKTEAKYSSIERVSIVGDEVVYMHANNLMAYILPSSCFASRAQYESFIEFIKTKCLTVDKY